MIRPLVTRWRQARARGDHAELQRDFDHICEVLAATRPTAVNLFWAICRMRDKFEQLSTQPIPRIQQKLVTEAQRMLVEDIAANQAMGRHGAVLLPSSGGVLTHCNAGALASCGYGMALGVIRAAVDSGKKLHFFADETRPLLQGGRLTAWELEALGIPHAVIADSAAASMMAAGEVDCVVTGADRIAANGDTANKIGTYSLAVLAAHHGIPLYVVAPSSTIDLATADGAGIPIEERDAAEITSRFAARNPAFDVTPAALIAAIVTEDGIHRAPYAESLAPAPAPA